MRDITSSAGGVSLRQLLPAATLFGADDVVVQACTADSRTCHPGDLFAALVGCHVDGHEYVSAAVQRGAAAILSERYVPAAGIPVCVVPDSRIAFGEICQALAGHPSRKLKVIGVTGTNGKTSTSWLIASVLQAAGYTAGLTGTIVNSDGLAIDSSDMTTPPAPMLADWLARMAANGCSHAVLEVSSHALAQSRTAGIEFDAGCITNVRRDHLDFHNTIENYRQAKGRLLEQISPDGFAVLNADDAVCREFVTSFNGAALTIGLENSAELTATIIERHASEQTFLLHAGHNTAAVRTKIIGTGHVYNCLTAAAVGLLYGIPLTDIVRGLEQLEKIPGRLERVECGQPFSVFVDYAHTPDALASVLGSLRSTTPGRLLCVFGAGGQRDKEKRPLMAQAVEQAADLAIVTDDNPRRENPAKIRRDILRGFVHSNAVVVKPDRAEAIAWTLEQAEAGDCVLIAGKGHEDYQIVGNQRNWFDDREIARRWLYENISLPRTGAPALASLWRANAG
ncbi:MAG TPA: UDP-N-acetylmuramoyl-L-alanyl-D-glutamate--2,6-diaminopimelate ligase [Pirellulales bacterium]|jgi:UDP-N-acetylmuramoyl-L-alanyl-D-glutamate--2,6-diaminopimelate ligase|nr:UDP-N-acetylmuramoyl-L-alanyl-D-glutamate--2,6-diaminopimelate ligase [Pirellulales bacterium]